MESILSTQFLLVNLSNKEILKVSQQVESNRLRTTLFLVGFQVATRQTMLGCSAAGSAHSSHFSWEAVHRQAPEICHWEDGKIIFFHFLLPPPRPPSLPKEAPVCLWSSKQDEDQTSIRKKTGTHTFIDRANTFMDPVSQQRILSLCLKEFLQFVQDERQRDTACILHLASLLHGTQRLL